MNIKGKAELIDIDENYLEIVLEWRNQDFIRRVMYYDKVITLDEHKTWFERISKSDNSITKVFLFNGIPYGVINITNIDRKNQKCDWGFYIGVKNAPKGLGTLMGELALDYMFNNLKVRKVCAEVLGFNQKSINFHQKLGFEQEGILKKHIWKNNQYVDVYIMALFSGKVATKNI
jgi:UDP-4-amino-4,6-dideoxy-N-acetyl-beta-L-altrosamine N-acetyltransferase